MSSLPKDIAKWWKKTKKKLTHNATYRAAISAKKKSRVKLVPKLAKL